jgi:hypothetical protein
MKNIFHPSTFATVAPAFLIALRLAATTKSALTIMHVDGTGEGEWSDLPGVRKTLSRWGMLKDEHDLEEFEQMGICVNKQMMMAMPGEHCLDYLSSIGPTSCWHPQGG